MWAARRLSTCPARATPKPSKSYSRRRATTLGTRYPGITDLSSLNDSASVNANLKVSVVVSDDNNMIVTTIFVAYNQNNA